MTEPAKPLRDRRRLNRGDMAEMLGVSLTKLDAMVRQGCPIAERPGRGKPSVFDTAAVLRWYFTPRAASVEDPEQLPPNDRKQWYLGESLRREIETRDMELIPATEAEAAVTDAHNAISAFVRMLPCELQDRAGLTDEQTDEARQILGEALVDLTDRLAPYAPGLTATNERG